MIKKLTALALACLLAVLLAGCDAFAFQNVNDLLRAPALGQGQDAVQRALAAHLGETPQYKYPKLGDWRSPLYQGDFDGDGQDEAILLFSLPDATTAGRERSNNVYIAILEKREDGWTVVQDAQGLSTDVASLEVADLLADGTLQLLVGYANSSLTAKTLALYTYTGEKLTLVYRADYSTYLIDDFTGRDGRDLIVVSADDQLGGLKLQYVPVEAGRFVTAALPEPVVLDDNFGSCVAITPSTGREVERLLVLDGTSYQQDNQLFSQIIYYGGGRFYTVNPNPLRGASARTSSSSQLRSRDIDGDGRVEVPLRLGTLTTMKNDKRLEYIEWMDFVDQTAENPEVKEFGILDPDRAIYVGLPDDWRDKVEVEDGDAQGEWRLVEKRTRRALLALRILEQEDLPPMNSERVAGTLSTYLVYQAGLTQTERDLIHLVTLG